MPQEIESKKVLVVEDEPDMQFFLSNLLNESGFYPIDAKDKDEGLKKAIKENPAVIIIDMMMPGEWGIRLYRDLKRDATLRRVPVIMLSTIDRKTFFQCQKFQGLRSGKGVPAPNAYLEKPPETEELLDLVRSLSVKRNSKT